MINRLLFQYTEFVASMTVDKIIIRISLSIGIYETGIVKIFTLVEFMNMMVACRF